MGIQHASNLSIVNNQIGEPSPLMCNHFAAGNKKIEGVHLFFYLP